MNPKMGVWKDKKICHFLWIFNKNKRKTIFYVPDIRKETLFLNFLIHL